ncbi:hypothetical protein EVAR_21224_1 [Eumeta japonica]|uniref:Uncharacterized protein n=1 Tax=Eumeta variegata TaxID=151549 RepID=A0A4C1UQ42_EUMVA|nr:hypothetical protein EVAR_21224_1 [Eumeta japonica]
MGRPCPGHTGCVQLRETKNLLKHDSALPVAQRLHLKRPEGTCDANGAKFLWNPFGLLRQYSVKVTRKESMALLRQSSPYVYKTHEMINTQSTIWKRKPAGGHPRLAIGTVNRSEHTGRAGTHVA